MKEVNQRQLQENLQKTYDRNFFAKEVLKKVFGQAFEQYAREIPAETEPTKSQKKVIDKVWQYGEIRLEDAELNCYEVALQPSVRLEHSRVAIQQYVRSLLSEDESAFINFVSPKSPDTWRFTFVAKESILEGEKVKTKSTEAKRYTYLLGINETCRTPAERFALLAQEEFTLENVKKAFAVEKLSKEFFKEYLQHYDKFVAFLNDSNFKKSAFNGKEKAIRDFSKKLLGRIVFLYFVQKKGWLGASNLQYQNGNIDFMLHLFKKSGADDTFYPNWLYPLFFETLNTERKEDKFEMPDAKSLKIPFLNGGLFEKDKFDQETDLLTFEPALFHNPLQEDKPNERGFLDFLNAYNFTIHEDSPNDHTIAVDPEMLGHIFENLLEDNKDKGTFYTPKDIVQYMCQQSLAEYLKTHLESEKDFIEAFVLNKALHTTDKTLKKIDELLDKVKICDPAIGSGAFPMGLLQEILALKEMIAFRLNQEWKPAQVKAHIIQNSIYGVDIEKGAVDIARLRFWLSLVIEEERPQPLPNLDYKIMQGNSLLSKFEEEVIDIDWSMDTTKEGIYGQKFLEKNISLLQKISQKQQAFFSPESKEKQSLRSDIRKLKIEVLSNQLEMLIQTKGINKQPTGRGAKYKKQFEQFLKTEGWKKSLNKLKNLQKNPEIPFLHFDWKLDFPDILNEQVNQNTGFDIVIGNPPYVQIQKFPDEIKEQWKAQNFETFAQTGDIYGLFYEKGFQLLNNKGLLSFITSNKWMRAGYGKKLRQFFAQKTKPLQLIDFGGHQVFETATVDTNILMFSRNLQGFATLEGLRVEKDFTPKTNLNQYFQENKILLNNLSDDIWTIASAEKQAIKNKIEKIGTPLKDWDINIYRGVLTGYNEAFIIDENKKNELIAQDPKSAEIIKPILRGRDIQRYKANFAGLYLINAHNGVKAKNIPRIDVPKNYPAIYKHLQQFETQAKKRQDKGDHWTNLRNCAYIEEFEKEKIVYPNMTKFLPFIYDKNGEYFTNQKCFIITGELLVWLVAFLNSKLFKFTFRDNFPELQGGTRELSKMFFDKIPVKQIPQSSQKPFEEKVEKILSLKEQGKDTSSLEKEIDAMVYELYGLTAAEIAIIENN